MQHHVSWADRGQLLQLDGPGEGDAPGAQPTRHVGCAHLGVVKVTAPQFNVWMQIRGDGWIESREGRFRMRRGDWMAFEKDSSPVIQSGAQGICLGLLIDAETLQSLESLNGNALYAGRGRLPLRELRTVVRVWREAATTNAVDGLAIRPLLLQLAGMQRDLAPACGAARDARGSASARSSGACSARSSIWKDTTIASCGSASWPT